MRKKLLISVFALLLATALFSQSRFTFSGKVTDASSGKPVEFATVVLEGTEQWAVADIEGNFTVKNVPTGKNLVTVSCLGYVSWSREIQISRDITTFKVSIHPDNLSLEGAMVTAKEDANSATTSRTIDKTALEHVQLMNVADISSLLPGGATVNPSLTSEQQFSIRAGSGENGNASFGTAVEVDGVRLSNNASFTNGSTATGGTAYKGVSTNNIGSSNIESVEIITGVPSVEYGDMSSGVVKINTRKGKTPWSVTMSTSPRTKQASVSKGFGLGYSSRGRTIGVLNASLEYTRSISEQMSPYTAYDRKQLSLTYNNLFSEGLFSETPLRISAGVTGNVGGLDNKADPDKMVGTWLKRRDNSIRVNFSADWLLSKPWITNLELNASAVYSDKLERENKYYDSAVSTTSVHSVSEGYFMAGDYVEGSSNDAILVPPGRWYNTMALDDRPLTTKVSIKANLAKNAGRVNNKIKAGADWTVDKNFGTGVYSEDLATAPTYRVWQFCEVPAMQNVAAYIEDNFMLRTGKDSRLNMIAGLRWDNTIVRNSAYGVTSSLSPRFNAKYTALTEKGRRNKLLQELSMRASWGVAVKQPSFSILYPTPGYMDIDVFSSTASAGNVMYRAYYVMPRKIEYNADLVWQSNRQAEVGVDFKLAGTKISIAAFRNTTLNAFNSGVGYDRFTYTRTPVSAVQGLAIPAEDRIYSVNPADGSITVSDRTGTISPVSVTGDNLKQFISSAFEDNDDNPLIRQGLEWVVDFKRISPINTTIRLDGNYYTYRSLLTDIEQYCPTTQTCKDGSPYRYIGYFYGGNSNANGRLTRNLRTNVTVTTHIPKVRMILSVKFESCLVSYSHALSERKDGSTRSVRLDDKTDLLSISSQSIYDGPGFSALYPDSFCSFDDPAPKPFLETLKWAKANDSELFSDLSKLVVSGTTYNYTFLEDRLTPYFSANISVTKELGDLASVSFYANNFFNNLGQVRSSKTGNYTSVYAYIPRFYYGLTLRLKFQ